MQRSLTTLAVFGLALLLAGCTYNRNGPVTDHFADFKTAPPRHNTVTVCSAYGCQKQTKVRFGKKQIAAIRKVMKKIRRKDTPYEERRAVAYAISWMEIYTGKIVGTSADRPGMEYGGSGDPTQQDCVDEATNTTSYLMILERNGLLKHHKVGTPFSKGNVIFRGVAKWPHWTAILVENKTKQRYAVDSWKYGNGENPAIVRADKWYIKDLEGLAKPTA